MLMDDAAWFGAQLQSSMDALLWAVELNPPTHLYAAPPRRPDSWPVARVLLHLGAYEQRLALPSMRQWLGEARPEVGTQAEETAREDECWAGQPSVAALNGEFRAVRAAQLALLPQFPAPAWDEPRDCIWGAVTLRWVLAKTLQHTFEHADEILRAALWWRE
jgi:hypothetical protein